LSNRHISQYVMITPPHKYAGQCGELDELDNDKHGRVMARVELDCGVSVRVWEGQTMTVAMMANTDSQYLGQGGESITTSERSEI